MSMEVSIFLSIERTSSSWFDVPPVLSSTAIWSPIPQREEIGRAEALFRSADHLLPARGRGRNAGEGADRQSVGCGQGVSGRVDVGGGRQIKNKQILSYKESQDREH